jgi:shikimate kinase
VNAPRNISNLALIGFMGTGKSSVGRIIAAQLHFQFIDTDEWIESRIGRPISEVFAQQGEAAFREMERHTLAELAQQKKMVISTGGGLVTNLDNLASLREHALLICLWASPETIWGRVRDQTHRPLLRVADPQANIRRLLAEREPFYRQADVLLNTEMRSIKEVAQHALLQFRTALSRQR